MEIDGQNFPEMQCSCGAGTCIVHTSRTERNPGRKFYRCPGMQGRRCEFFKWCDIASPLKRVKSGVEPMDIDGQSFPEMQCPCGVGACIVRTSWTEKNPGRKFYGCSGIQGRKCDFFKWCDSASPLKRVILESEIAELSTIQPMVNPCQAQLDDSRNNSVNHQSPQIAQKDMCFNCNKFGHWARDCPEKAKTKKELPAVRSFDGQYLPEMECRCGVGTCPILTAKTPENPGRKFYRCPGKDGQGACSFYQFLDSPQKPANSICLEETNAFSLRSVSNAQEVNDSIKDLGGSKLERMLPSGSPKKPLSKECGMTVETNGLGSRVLDAYFLPVESLRLNKCSSAESDAKLVESTQSGKVRQSQKDCSGSPGASFKWVKLSCILEFDGASKGNPGQAGAGAVLRAEDGSIVCRLREGVGVATNNVAEYRALILGLKYALKKGYTQIHARGDSQLVCKQVEGQWKTKNPSMSKLCNEAKELKDKFSSFHIYYIARDANWEADAQANLAVNLVDGEVQELCDY
ncbi:uncharacterized protein LOC122670862 isoform X2 [Telopea speciosissima]|uniref:uncharacterized protein LOC122670862 isoform X2 n=1 Tax=Telopea speciosissima TaxID=54955 RepID=UPI001CC77857|nr:uncharacterized protein LOC122670862 isoform X2 [Telopea speciosissima]